MGGDALLILCRFKCKSHLYKNPCYLYESLSQKLVISTILRHSELSLESEESKKFSCKSWILRAKALRMTKYRICHCECESQIRTKCMCEAPTHTCKSKSRVRFIDFYTYAIRGLLKNLRLCLVLPRLAKVIFAITKNLNFQTAHKGIQMMT